MLERLLELAPAGSDASQFGQLQLAELMIAKQPFRAASLARSVARRCSSDRAWGVVGLAMTVLGHYRAAVKAFRRSISHRHTTLAICTIWGMSLTSGWAGRVMQSNTWTLPIVSSQQLKKYRLPCPMHGIKWSGSAGRCNSERLRRNE